MHEKDRQVEELIALLRERYGELLQEIIFYPHGGVTVVLITGDREAYSAAGELLQPPRERALLRWARLLPWGRARNR